MSEQTDPRVLAPSLPTYELIFHDYHEPTLPAGTYELDIRHDLSVRSGDDLAGNTGVKIRVAGPQLSLPTGSVTAVFPANLASGRFFTSLPHVMLSRGTLPWERLPTSQAGTVRSPWMVLLVLDEDEILPTTRYRSTRGKLRAGISREDGHEDMVELLRLPASDVADLLPPLTDLPWLAHVRTMVPKGVPAKFGAETATVIANRLPTPGKQNHAFLVSVENRYAGVSIQTGAAKTLSFPVLHEWSFFCEAEHAHGFVELLTTHDGVHNDPLPMTLVAPARPAAAAKRIGTGFVPVEHHVRTGEVTAGWYHGPLLPGRPPVQAALIEPLLPATQSDDLMLTDQEFAMFDVSYAAAWELGRLIALEHNDKAREIYEWKRTFTRNHHRTQGVAKAAGVKALHRARLHQPAPALPDSLDEWITTALLELREVPFRYLVPDEELLPASGFRFFDIDPLWIECLRDGAISVGRTDSQMREIEADMRKHLAKPKTMSGFLLRSSAVADFPHLEVDGYNAAPVPGSFAKPSLPILRMERLSPSVLLVLFDGRAKAVDVHLHPQAVHFGFSLGTGSVPGAEHFTKDFPTTIVKKVQQHATVGLGHFPGAHNPPVLLNGRRRVEVAALAAEMQRVGFGGQPRSVGQGGVADFARRMLEGVPLVRFKRDLGATA